MSSPLSTSHRGETLRLQKNPTTAMKINVKEIHIQFSSPPASRQTLKTFFKCLQVSNRSYITNLVSPYHKAVNVPDFVQTKGSPHMTQRVRTAPARSHKAPRCHHRPPNVLKRTGNICQHSHPPRSRPPHT